MNVFREVRTLRRIKTNIERNLGVTSGFIENGYISIIRQRWWGCVRIELDQYQMIRDASDTGLREWDVDEWEALKYWRNSPCDTHVAFQMEMRLIRQFRRSIQMSLNSK